MFWFYMSLATAVLWGITYASTEQIVKTVDMKTYLAISCIVSATIYLIWGYFDGCIKKDLAGEQIYIASPWITLSCLCSFFACYCSVAAVKYGGASYASIIEISYPVWVIVFTSMITGKNQVTLSTILGGVLIFLGTLVVMRSNNGH